MSKVKAAATDSVSSDQKILEAKWGKHAIAAGWAALPVALFRNQKALGLKPLDVLILLHLASYWWKPNEPPRPAKGTIADMLDVDPRTVQRSIQKMEKLGYVKREMRRASVGDNAPNAYDLSGLVKALKKPAEEMLARRATRAAEDKARVATPTAFALIAGGKK